MQIEFCSAQRVCRGAFTLLESGQFKRFHPSQTFNHSFRLLSLAAKTEIEASTVYAHPSTSVSRFASWRQLRKRILNVGEDLALLSATLSVIPKQNGGCYSVRFRWQRELRKFGYHFWLALKRLLPPSLEYSYGLTHCLYVSSSVETILLTEFHWI